MTLLIILLSLGQDEYNRLGFVWRSKLYLFVSFVWGCRHAGYAGQWLSSAVSFIHANLGLQFTGLAFFILNYADDYAGAEPDLERATLSFDMIGQLLSDLGLEESVAKACPPSTSMTYLGVLFNTIDMCLHVDPEKLRELKAELKKWTS